VSAPVVLADAGKQYTKYEDAPMLISAALRFRSRSTRAKLWAVRHVDLEVAEGDCVGVIGRNGSGKSTTLQMLAGVTAPSEGLVRVRGRIAPLISVGVGFHPELTGRENVYVNGMILGLTRQQVEDRFEAILDFSEIASFIDTPVKFYSSGMFVRLGFSVAIHADPEVLLVDEVLAVGDLAFQLKCFERMMAIRESGATILVVSHNLNAVRKLCDRTAVLHRGEQRFDGPTADAISLYHDLIDEQREIDDVIGDDADEDGKALRRGAIRVVEGRLLGPDGSRTGHVHSGDQVVFELEVEVEEDIENPILGIGITNEKNVHVYSESSILHPVGTVRAGERAVFSVAVDMDLVTGSYRATVGLTDPEDLQVRLGSSRPLNFYVSGRSMARGVADLEAEFRLRRLERDPR
jgi:ABC-type polysaccharide/polyol phosphate transport system ATPase subunit